MSAVCLFSAAGHAQPATPATPADGSTASPEDVVVTARKVSERAQDVPASIDVITGSQLQMRDLNDLTEVARETPNFSFGNYNGAFPTPVIRGQSQTRITNPVQNVATFWDGIYLQRGFQVDPDFLNLDRIEIIRGPENAALGRNAFAGAVNFVTREPTDTVRADVIVSGGTNGYQNYVTSLSGPLIPGKLDGIFGWNYGAYDGSWKNNIPTATSNLGSYEKDNYMAGLHFTPTDKLTVNLNWTTGIHRFGPTASYTQGGGSLEGFNTNNCSPAAAFGGVNQLICGTLGTSPTIAPGSTRAPGLVVDPRSYAVIHSNIWSLSGNYEINDVYSVDLLYGHTYATLLSAGATSLDPAVGYTSVFAGPYYGYNFVDSTGNDTITSDSFEARLNIKPTSLPVRGYFGLYHSNTDDHQKGSYGLWVPQTSGPLLPEIVDPYADTDSEVTTAVNAAFAFAEANYDNFFLSLEGRETNERQVILDRPNSGNGFTSATAGKTFDYFTPKGSLSYHFTNYNNVYFSIARGVKAGGFNANGSNPATFADPGQATYLPESNITYEIGTKNEFLDHRLLLNAALFHIESTNLQVDNPLISTNGTIGTVIGNAAGATTNGFELESRYKATQEVLLFGGVGYAHATYNSGVIDADIPAFSLCNAGVCRSNGNIGGNRIQNAPEWTGNVGVSYHHDFEAGYELYGNVIETYVGDQFINDTNTTKVAPYALTDASIGLTWARYDLRLTAKNLLDNKYVMSAFDNDFGASPFFNVRNNSAFLGERRLVYVALHISY